MKKSGMIFAVGIVGLVLLFGTAEAGWVIQAESRGGRGGRPPDRARHSKICRSACNRASERATRGVSSRTRRDGAHSERGRVRRGESSALARRRRERGRGRCRRGALGVAGGGRGGAGHIAPPETVAFGGHGQGAFGAIDAGGQGGETGLSLNSDTNLRR